MRLRLAALPLAFLLTAPTLLPQVSVVGTQKLPTGCSTGQVPVYSTVTKIWSCATSGATVLNLATTSTDGVVVANTTAATVGVPVQISPRVRLSGTGWDTDNTVSRTVGFFTELLPVSGTDVVGHYRLGYIDTAGAITYPFIQRSDGRLDITGSFNSTAGNTASGYTASSVTGTFRVTTRTTIGMPADGQMNVTNNAITAGVGMDVATDALLKIRTRAQSAYASVDLLDLQLSGKIAFSSTAPTISSGFGTSPSVTTNNGTAAFTINVGTGGTAQNGVIGLPTATAGWVVHCNNVTNTASSVVAQTASSTTSATVQNYSRTTGLAAAWAASDILHCLAVAR